MWTRRDTFWLLDRTVSIRSQSDSFSQRILDLFRHADPPFQQARPRDTYAVAVEDGQIKIYRDCHHVETAVSLEMAVSAFLVDLNRHMLYSFEGFSAHAGVVANAAGEAVLFPGTSGAGKSTLTSAAVRAGFGYLSDEALCVDFGSTEALPYLKPVNLARWSRHRLAIDDRPDFELPVPPADLGLLHDKPSRIAHVVQLERPAPLELVELPRSTSVGTLVKMSFTHYENPPETFRTVTEIARQSQSWMLRYDDPVEAAELLRDRLGS